MGNMQIYLRAKDKLFINGAVIRVDRKVSIELLNDATFILQNHVLQAEEANTPIRQLYFTIQLMLVDPLNRVAALDVFKTMSSQMLSTLKDRKLLEAIKDADVLVSSNKPFPALKVIRDVFERENELMVPQRAVPSSSETKARSERIEERANG